MGAKMNSEPKSVQARSGIGLRVYYLILGFGGLGF